MKMEGYVTEYIMKKRKFIYRSKNQEALALEWGGLILGGGTLLGGSFLLGGKQVTGPLTVLKVAILQAVTGSLGS
jgi:hypothetical protein